MKITEILFGSSGNAASTSKAKQAGTDAGPTPAAHVETEEERRIRVATERMKQFGQDIPPMFRTAGETQNNMGVQPATKPATTTTTTQPASPVTMPPLEPVIEGPIGLPPIKPVLKVK